MTSRSWIAVALFLHCLELWEAHQGTKHASYNTEECPVGPQDSSSPSSPEEEPTFSNKAENATVCQGREALLSCVVDNLGCYRVAWIKVESKTILTIHNVVITRNYRIHLSYSDNKQFILHIKNVQESDRGWYMCQINTVPMLSQVNYLDVLVPPDFIAEESLSDIVAREGTDVGLRCRAKGYPLPAITWRREDNEPIPLGPANKRNRTTVFSGELLNISRVSRLHMGAYLCIASNGVPPSVSRRIILHVQFLPAMWIPNQVVGAPLGKNVTLDCHIEAYPSAATYWIRVDKEPIYLSPSDKYETSQKRDGYKIHTRLTISHLRRKDYGVYTCFAKNALGATEATVRLYEVPLLGKDVSKDKQSWKKNYEGSTQDLEASHDTSTASNWCSRITCLQWPLTFLLLQQILASC